MSEERLLRDLAALVREHQGELARLESACKSGVRSASLSEAELVEPLGPAFHAAMVSRLSQDLAPANLQKQADARRAEATSPPKRDPLAALTAFVSALLHRPALGFGVGAAAVVVAVLGVSLFRMQPGDALALPGYEVSLQGKASMRGDEADGGGSVTFVAGDGFRLLLRPKTALDGAITARAFVRIGDKLESLQAPAPQIFGSGVVLIEGQVGRNVLLPAGASHLVVVVARPGASPNERELTEQLSARSEAFAEEWHAWSVEVILNP
jgi:hypothetical protein